MAPERKLIVFVLMPFSEAFDDCYQLAIKPACEAVGASAERVDEQIFSETILQRIYEQIRSADLIVAEMSGRSANVFYEVGYAHATGKRVVLVTSTAADIPFDLKHYAHVVYEGSLVKLRTELQRRLEYWSREAERKVTASPPASSPTTLHSLWPATSYMGIAVVRSGILMLALAYAAASLESAIRGESGYLLAHIALTVAALWTLAVSFRRGPISHAFVVVTVALLWVLLTPTHAARSRILDIGSWLTLAALVGSSHVRAYFRVEWFDGAVKKCAEWARKLAQD